MNRLITENELQNTATEWLVKLQSDALTEQDKQAFLSWLKADDSHQQAYIDAEKFWDRLSILETAQPASGSNQRVTPIRRKSFIPAALAACFALFVVGIIAVTGLFEKNNHYMTAIGEQQALLLEDGSHIQLNTDSVIRTDLNAQRRLVHLVRGEAFFEVAKDSDRPFIVKTDSGLVRVLGTQFNVLSEEQQSTVTVLEGRVGLINGQNITAAAEPSFTPEVTLTADQQSTIAQRQEIAQPKQVTAGAITAWRAGKLIYNGESFASVLKDINRYFEGEIRLGEPELEDLEVTAVFQLQDKETTLKALEEAFNVAAVTLSDELTLLYPKK